MRPIALPIRRPCRRRAATPRWSDHRAGPHRVSVRPARHDAGRRIRRSRRATSALRRRNASRTSRRGSQSVGAGFEHVVKITNFFVDMAHLPVFFEVRDSS